MQPHDPDAGSAFAFDFRGKTAVITGGARGFGLEFGRALAMHGATVILGDVDVETGTRAAEELQAQGLAVDFEALDVCKPEDSAAVVRRVVERYGRLDVWVNNAGIARHGASDTLPAETWSLPLDIMLSGTFFGAQAAGRQMIEQEGGCIINIASVNGLIAQSGRASYASAKAGVIRLTEVLASEWAAYKIRVNAIAPAVFMTDLARASLADGSASLDVYLRRSPTHRLGEIPELIPTVLFLASPYSSYITGQTLRVDGGWTADHDL